MEERRTRTRKGEEEKRLVQAGRKRGSHLCASYTEFTATEEISKRDKTARFQEKGGIAIKRLLQRSDPCKPRQYEREDCLVCRTDGKGPCDRQSVTYEIKCTECNNIYVGETSRSAYTRGKEHEKSLSNKEERSALWKHCKEKHNNEMQRFQMSVTGLYRNDAMLRQISEGVRIEKVPGDSLR